MWDVPENSNYVFVVQASYWRLARKAGLGLDTLYYYLYYRPTLLSHSTFTGIRAAGARHNLVSLVRLMLSDAEMAQRQSNTGRFSLASILLSFGEYDAAIEHLHDGQRLISSPENVLRNAGRLLTYGLENEARQLFDLAEPLDLLSGAKQIRHFDPAHETHYLRVWASAAIHFRSISQIIAAIQRVVVEPDPIVPNRTHDKETDEDKACELRNSLLLQAGLALLEETRWDDLLQIEKVLLGSGSSPETWWFQLRARSWLKCLADGDITKARSLIQDTLQAISHDTLSDFDRIVIADGLLRIDEDQVQVRQWIEKVSPIGTQDIPSFNFGLSIFNHLFRHARLLYVFGDQRSPAEMIPDPADSRKLGSVYFQRGICAIARIWASSWIHQLLDPATIRQESFPLVRLFYHSWRETKWDSWLSLVELKADFYSMLIDAVSLHGVEAVTALADEFVSEWNNNSRYWSSDSIREIALAFNDAGMGSEWAAERLEDVTPLIEILEIGSRIEEEIHQVHGWLALGKLDKAQASLTEALIDAASVGSKDYQLGEWIEWMQDANRRNAAEAVNRIAWFAGAVRDLERNGGPAKAAAYDLLEATAEWSPRRAVLLFIWFFSEGLIHFGDAVLRIVRLLMASESVSSSVAQAVLLHFLIPLCNDDEDVVHSVVERTFKTEGRDETIGFAQEFKSAIEVHALGSRRPGWLRGLAASLRKCGIDTGEIGFREDALQAKESSSTDEGLKLKDGTTLSLAQIKERIQTVDDLRKLTDARSSSFYHWDDVIASLAPRLTNSVEIMQVVGLFSTEIFSATILVTFARRLVELGDLDQAREVARLALSTSETSGWAVHLSGGTKIEAFKVLTSIDEDSAREEAFAELVKDMSLTRWFEGSTYTYTGATVQYLRDILPLISNTVPLDDLWPEIESYVHNLFPGVSPDDIDESLILSLSNAPDTDMPAEALVDLLSIYAAHPANLLSDCASAAFVKLMLAKDLLLIMLSRASCWVTRWIKNVL